MEESFKRIRVNTFPEEFQWEGVVLTLASVGTPIEPGDTYIAGRNTGPHILTCRKIGIPSPGIIGGNWIVAKEKAYPFDIHECRKILAVDREAL